MLEALRTTKHIAIFEMVNTITKGCYIDFSLNATLEVDMLIQDLREGQFENKKLQKDWNQYGYGSFKLHILEDFDDEKIKDTYSKEDELIRALYNKVLSYLANRKEKGYEVYNNPTRADYENKLRKYFSYNKEGKWVIKPYKQKVILDEAAQWAVLMTDEKTFPPHSHEEIELIYVLNQSIDITVNNTTYYLKPRDILFVSSKDIHSFTTPGLISNRAILIFKVPNIGDTFEFLSNKRPLNPLIPYCEEEDFHSLHKMLEDKILMIMNEYRYKKNQYKLIITAGIYDILSLIIRNLEFESFTSGQAKKLHKDMQNIEKIFNYVNQHYQENISLQDVATLSNYSLYHFTRFFKKMTGMTFSDYLAHFRVQKSSEFLMETEKSITEIAYLCGFNSIKTYNRIFKKLKHMSPREFKKSNF